MSAVTLRMVTAFAPASQPTSRRASKSVLKAFPGQTNETDFTKAVQDLPENSPTLIHKVFASEASHLRATLLEELLCTRLPGNR